jgi:hypothetical protein
MLGKQPIFAIFAELEGITVSAAHPMASGVSSHPGGSARAKAQWADLPAVPIGRSSARTVFDIKARTSSKPTTAPASWSPARAPHGPPEVMVKLARGDDVDPAHYYFRTVMRFETSDPKVDWLNRILALARGQREARAVRLDVYEVE